MASCHAAPSFNGTAGALRGSILRSRRAHKMWKRKIKMVSKTTSRSRKPNHGRPAPFPRARFAVLSDVHYYDTSLGTGSSFVKMIAGTRDIKLLADSPEIMESTVQSILAEKVDFVILCGDLTKDGERSSHELLARALKRLVAGGVRVFVVNGNHDVQNDRACRYSRGVEERIDSVSPAEFAAIYADLGYGTAVERDPASLSYVVEPFPGLWLVAMDSCRWREKFLEEGKFYPETVAWIKRVLHKARQQKKAVIGMMHHGVLEHYQGNKKYYGAYVIEDHERISTLFAQGRMKIVFTGHFHAQDIALKRWETPGCFLYDVETGSLVTYPCPYRIVTIDENQTMHIESRKVETTQSHPADFGDYAYRYSYSITKILVIKTLRRWLISGKDAELLAPQIVDAFTAHCTGNEREPEEVLNFRGVGWWGKTVLSRKIDLLDGLWHNGPPPDNHLTIDLRTGDYQGT